MGCDNWGGVAVGPSWCASTGAFFECEKRMSGRLYPPLSGIVLAIPLLAGVKSHSFMDFCTQSRSRRQRSHQRRPLPGCCDCR